MSAAHRFQIFLELRDAGIPRLGIRRLRICRPVAFRPLRRHVIRIAAELENIPLSDPHMLEKLPCGVRSRGDLLAAKFYREISERLYRIPHALPYRQAGSKGVPVMSPFSKCNLILC